MNAEILLQRSATDVLGLLESGAVMSLQLIDAVIARIEQRDDDLWATHVALAASPGAAGDFSRLVTQSFRDGLAALEAQALITSQWASTRFDVVLCPAVPVAAPVLSAPGDELRMIAVDGRAISTSYVNSWSRLTNLAKLPSTVVPLGPGSVSGLPLGAQLLAPHLEDRTSLQLALDASTAGLLAYAPPPAFT